MEVHRLYFLGELVGIFDHPEYIWYYARLSGVSAPKKKLTRILLLLKNRIMSNRKELMWQITLTCSLKDEGLWKGMIIRIRLALSNNLIWIFWFWWFYSLWYSQNYFGLPTFQFLRKRSPAISRGSYPNLWKTISKQPIFE